MEKTYQLPQFLNHSMGIDFQSLAYGLRC